MCQALSTHRECQPPSPRGARKSGVLSDVLCLIEDRDSVLIVSVLMNRQAVLAQGIVLIHLIKTPLSML